MVSKIYYKNPEIGLAVQMLNLIQMYPQSKCYIKSNILNWECILRPTEGSQKYLVRIEYKPGYMPKSYVLSPELKRYHSLPLPHVYSELPFPRLCLFYPKAKEWTGNMLLAKSIVPWICEWLFFYELSLVTGEWHADEIKHIGNKN